jgi:DNA-directed RNA polymerase subunit F
MIKNSEALSMAEVQGYLEKEENDIVLNTFIKKFSKISAKDAKELRKNLKGLDMIKINERDISKIIDILPQTKEELNKVCQEAGLDEDEANKILDEIKKIK